MKLHNKLFYLGPICLMSLIFFLSHQPRVMEDLPQIDGLDKLLHCIAYLSLASSWLVCLMINNVRSIKTKTFVYSMSFALTDEFHQTFIPTRAFEVGDLVADGIGVCLGIFVLLPIMLKFLNRVRQN